MKVIKRGVQVVLDRYRYIDKNESNNIDTRKSKQYIGPKADKNKEIIIIKHEELESLITSVDYGGDYLQCIVYNPNRNIIKSDDLTIRASIKKMKQELPPSFVAISQDTILNISLIVGKCENRIVTKSGNKYKISSKFLKSVSEKIDELYYSVDFFKP